jgi:hypothetical protein
MKRAIMGVVSGAMLLAIGVTGLGWPRTPRINGRQENQQDRIQQGIRDGSLNRREASRLESIEGRIQADKLFAKRDGNVSPRERVQLNRELNRASRDIYHLRHNGKG